MFDKALLNTAKWKVFAHFNWFGALRVENGEGDVFSVSRAEKSILLARLVALHKIDIPDVEKNSVRKSMLWDFACAIHEQRSGSERSGGLFSTYLFVFFEKDPEVYVSRCIDANRIIAARGGQDKSDEYKDI